MQSETPQILVKVRSMIVFCAVAFLSLLAMFRIYGYDRDYFRYLRFFENTSFDDPSRFEPGFHFVANIIKWVTGPDAFSFFLFVIAFFSLIPKFLIIRDSRNYILMMVVYMLLIMPLHEMTQIRVAVACGLMFWGLHTSINSSCSLSVRSIWVLLGLSFHYSTIILAPFLLFPNWFKKRSVVRIIAFPIFIALLVSSSITVISELIPIVDFYVTQIAKVEKVDINPYSSRNIIFLLLIVVGLSNLDKIPHRMLPWFYVSVSGLTLWYCFMWLPVFAHRFLEITVFSYLVWVPSLPFRARIFSLSLLLVLGFYFTSRMIFFQPMFVSNV